MNAHALITALGGTYKVAAILGLRPSAVSNWKRDGAIPAKWYLPLARAAVTNGVAISPDAFKEPA